MLSDAQRRGEYDALLDCRLAVHNGELTWAQITNICKKNSIQEQRDSTMQTRSWRDQLANLKMRARAREEYGSQHSHRYFCVRALFMRRSLPGAFFPQRNTSYTLTDADMRGSIDRWFFATAAIRRHESASQGKGESQPYARDHMNGAPAEETRSRWQSQLRGLKQRSQQRNFV